ncbi:MAG: protoporphyrinogen oxidase [Deltaproteobacteria bacterium]|nr:protoporphyrinogen oxidase [Deltaproteobacteria bacterium]
MKIAVIGAGIGGLAAARALVAGGHEVTVFEASERAGGVVGSTRVDGFLREHAASSFLGGPPRGALALCHELGVAVDKASPNAKTRWIYLDGKLRALPSSPLSLATTDLMTWRGKLALLREPFRARAAAGEDESVHAFAARRLGPEAARAFVAPFVTGVFAADSHDISLAAGFPKFAALEAEGGLVRGMIKQMVRGVRDKTPKTPRGLYAPAGGVGRLAEAMASSLGSRVRTEARVSSIVSAAAGGVSVDGERFDGAVIAIPAALAADLVGDLPELAAKLRVFKRAPTAIVYLGMPEAAVTKARNGFGFLVGAGEDVRVLGCVFETTVWPDRAPSGQALLRCIFGGSRDPDAASLAEQELIALARHDLERVLGATGEPTHASVVRWPRGIAQYAVGHKDLVRAAVAAARKHRIALAGADYRGAGINDLIADGDVVAAEVRTWG